MRRDIHMLLQADMVMFLPGWEQSKGAQLEMRIAEELELEILFWIDWNKPEQEVSREEQIIAALKAQLELCKARLAGMEDVLQARNNDAHLGVLIRKMPLRSTLTRQVGGGYRYKTHDKETGELTGEFGTYAHPEDALSTIG